MNLLCFTFFVLLTFSRFCCNEDKYKAKKQLKNVSESINSHTIYAFPPIPIPECLFLLSYMQKSVIILLVSSNDTLAFQSLQRPVHKWPSLFFCSRGGSFPIFITDFVFLCFLLCFLFSAQHSFLCHVL